GGGDAGGAAPRRPAPGSRGGGGRFRAERRIRRDQRAGADLHLSPGQRGAVTEPRADSLVTPLRQELQAIATGLEVAPGPAERAALKRRIIALFKRTEATLGDLARFKEEIRMLVEKYKRLPAEPPATPPSAPELHQDHLGASTFVDKGWSLIASGDHGGAIQTLHRALELAPGDLKAQSLLGWAQMLSAQ